MPFCRHKVRREVHALGQPACPGNCSTPGQCQAEPSIHRTMLHAAADSENSVRPTLALPDAEPGRSSSLHSDDCRVEAHPLPLGRCPLDSELAIFWLSRPLLLRELLVCLPPADLPGGMGAASRFTRAQAAPHQLKLWKCFDMSCEDRPSLTHSSQLVCTEQEPALRHNCITLRLAVGVLRQRWAPYTRPPPVTSALTGGRRGRYLVRR